MPILVVPPTHPVMLRRVTERTNARRPSWCTPARSGWQVSSRTALGVSGGRAKDHRCDPESETDAANEAGASKTSTCGRSTKTEDVSKTCAVVLRQLDIRPGGPGGTIARRLVILEGRNGEYRPSEDAKDRHAEQKTLTHHCILPATPAAIAGLRRGVNAPLNRRRAHLARSERPYVARRGLQNVLVVREPFHGRCLNPGEELLLQRFSIGEPAAWSSRFDDVRRCMEVDRFLPRPKPPLLHLWRPIVHPPTDLARPLPGGEDRSPPQQCEAWAPRAHLARHEHTPAWRPPSGTRYRPGATRCAHGGSCARWGRMAPAPAGAGGRTATSSGPSVRRLADRAAHTARAGAASSSQERQNTAATKRQ